MKKIFSQVLAAIILICMCTFTVHADFENNHINSGDYADDLASVALTQVGYIAEGTSKYGDGEIGNLKFFSWCASQASIPDDIIPEADTISELFDFFSENFRTNSNPEYIPQKGDIMFLSENGEFNACAVVISTDEQYVTAVLEDSDNEVKKKMYELGIEKITAYATPDYSFVSNYTEGKHMTTASNLNLRSEPNTSCSILTKIPIGTIVDITKFSGNWGYITYNGYSGWISMDYAVFFDDSHSDTSEYSVKWNVIDVSKWQGSIDWSKVAAGDIQGVIMRIGLRGSGTRQIVIDENFLTYYEGAKSAGLHVGCYFYTTATSTQEAVEEAEFVIDTVDKYDLEFDMPVYLDMEDAIVEKCGKTEIFNMTYAFLERMTQENIYSGVYCSTYWANAYYNQTLFTNHSLWIAEWHDKCNYNGEYGMWQYTSTGSVSGIESRYTDLNICYIDYPAFIRDMNYNNMTDKKELSPGDINGDGNVTAADARIALRISAYLYEPTQEEENAADINMDGTVTAADARTILRISAKLESL